MTVGQLIKHLEVFDKDTCAVILDTDTEWLLNITTVKHSELCAIIGGDYGDEYDGSETSVKEEL